MTDTTASQGAARATFHFAFDGVPDKEQTLFKSFVRLLQHRTHQTWLPAQGGTVHLMVVMDHHALASHPSTGILVLGTQAARRAHYVCLPIHADELETELNVMGGALLARREGASSAPQPLVPGERVRLLRWPSPTLLASRDHIRLATLMTGRPMTLQEVQQRSGVDGSVCSDFMHALDHAGVLEHEAPTMPAPLDMPRRAVVPPPGLIDRIRARLGLGAPGRA